ncbi:MAG TPA: tagaturonate epimerase family protein [Chthoniobacteraceae bacterium]|nr:tagaturonate epimerase family protein [Chthoniobacteraceae bacterium]
MRKSVTFSEPGPSIYNHAAMAKATEGGFNVENVRRGASINTSDLVITEAPLLNEEEQTDALEALIADGIFDSADWPSQYLARDFAVGDGETLRFDPATLLRTGIMYGWAVEQAARNARNGGPVQIAINAPGTIGPHEHLFIGLELRRRGVEAFDLALPWGGRWEPAVDWIGETEAFGQSLRIHRGIAETHGGWRLVFEHAEHKMTALPLLAGQCGEWVCLNMDGIGWIEAMRILARHEPALLRELLPVAQDRFVFDKPDAELATTEDDIRTLPDVPDSELERVIVDDFRGRQLLQVTALSLIGHETHGPAIRAALEEHQVLHTELVGEVSERHFAFWSHAQVGR